MIVRRPDYGSDNDELVRYKLLIGKRIEEIYKDVDPDEWLYIHDGDAWSEQMRHMARHWVEIRALVDTLEFSHLDDEYTPEKKYPLSHPIDFAEYTSRHARGERGPREVVESHKSRAEVILRLEHLSILPFGDDPDEWRGFFNAFDRDEGFPPVR